MAGYVFPEFTLPACGTTNYLYIQIEMETHDRLTNTWPTWTGLATALRSPFNSIPEVRDALESELGTLTGSNADFTCDNEVIESGVGVQRRLSDLVLAYNTNETIWHFRIKVKVGSAGTYSVVWWGWLPPSGIEITMGKNDDPSTWRSKLSCASILMLADEIRIDRLYFDTWLPHATYDVTCAEIRITSPTGSPPLTRNQLVNMLHFDGVTYTWIGAGATRWMKLRDIVQALANSMGLTADICNGAAVGCSWTFYWYNGTAEQTATWDDLYVSSGIYLNSQYQHHWGFFDADKLSDASFYHAGSVLELLKTILVPFGLVARVRWSGNTPYLDIVEIHDDNGVGFATWSPGAKLVPADRQLLGLKVVTPDAADSMNGTDGDGGTSIRCVFMSAQRLARYNRGYQATDDLPALYRSLWVLNGTTMENIYKIDVADAGSAVSWGQGMTAQYDEFNAGSVVGDASSAYWFNPITGSNDPVGIYRRNMRRLELEIPRYVPVSELDVRQYIDWNGQKWWVKERTWKLTANKTQFVCETGEW